MEWWWIVGIGVGPSVVITVIQRYTPWNFLLTNGGWLMFLVVWLYTAHVEPIIDVSLSMWLAGLGVAMETTGILRQKYLSRRAG